MGLVLLPRPWPMQPPPGARLYEAAIARGLVCGYRFQERGGSNPPPYSLGGDRPRRLSVNYAGGSPATPEQNFWAFPDGYSSVGGSTTGAFGIQSPSGPGLVGDLSIVTLLRFGSTAVERVICGQYDGANFLFAAGRNTNGNLFWYQGFFTKTEWSFDPGTSEFVHLGFVRTGTSVRLMANGAFNSAITPSGTIGSGTPSIYIGHEGSSSNDRIFAGQMRYIFVWNRALEDEEVMWHYENQALLLPWMP